MAPNDNTVAARVDDNVVERLEEYQDDRGLPSKSATARELLIRSLDAHESDESGAGEVVDVDYDYALAIGPLIDDARDSFNTWVIGALVSGILFTLSSGLVVSSLAAIFAVGYSLTVIVAILGVLDEKLFGRTLTARTAIPRNGETAE